METWLAAGLSVIIAFGLTTIAAVALANIVGLRIHDRERPLYGEDDIYLYLSDDAQDLRQRFRKLPGLFRNMYLIFIFFVFISICYGHFCLKELKKNLPLSDLIFQEQDVVLFVLMMALTYKIYIVIYTISISSHLYRVLRDT